MLYVYQGTTAYVDKFARNSAALCVGVSLKLITGLNRLIMFASVYLNPSVSASDSTGFSCILGFSWCNLSCWL